MQTHTPGPWSVFNPRLRTNPTKEARLLVLHPDGERLIARCNEGFSNSKGTLAIEEREANARLIAAAPELLAALEALFANCSMIHNVWGDGCNRKQADAAIAAARAAIAKATK